jgi:hypothetical protein
MSDEPPVSGLGPGENIGFGPQSGPVSGRPLHRKRNKLLVRMAAIGASAQAAIPGLYAWAITVAPAAWSRGAPILAKAAAVIGVLALVTAPLVEGAGPAVSPDEGGDRASAAAARDGAEAAKKKKTVLDSMRSWTGPTWARVWSVWGFVLSSAIVWALAPSALSSARLDGVRGALGMVGWALFAFASAGPTLRADPALAGRILASTSLKPRSEIPRGDGVYVAVGVVMALAMQGVGWGIAVPERAVLVRLVTVVCGIAVLGGTTSIALARHTGRIPASRRIRLRRAAPWLVMLVLVAFSGAVIGLLR